MRGERGGYPCHDALKDRIASERVAWQLTRRERKRKREIIPDPYQPRASRFSSASSRSGLRVTRPRLVTRRGRAHAWTRRRQAAPSFRAATPSGTASVVKTRLVHVRSTSSRARRRAGRRTSVYPRACPPAKDLPLPSASSRK